MKFKTRYPHYEYLKKKWVSKHADVASGLWEKHGESIKKITLTGMGGLMLLSAPTLNLLPSADQPEIKTLPLNLNPTIEDVSVKLQDDLNRVVPKEVRKLTSEEEQQISTTLSTYYNMEVTPEIEGIRLNRSYGLIGGEQHLYRYPGDTVLKHADTTTDWAMFGSSGIAPGLGAWGYFSPSKEQFDEVDKERERYYIAVPTFLSPGFAENTGKYRDFFKFRKMLIVNPKTGQAVVTDIGDAGPAEYTGKHLGGSPEVMHFLGLAGGPRKGAVLYFFIDDPNDTIPLGPIHPTSVRS